MNIWCRPIDGIFINRANIYTDRESGDSMIRNGKVADLFADHGILGLYAIENDNNAFRALHKDNSLKEDAFCLKRLNNYESKLMASGLKITNFAVTFRQVQMVVTYTGAGLKMVALTRPAVDMEKVKAVLESMASSLRVSEPAARREEAGGSDEVAAFLPEEKDAIIKAVVRIMGPIGTMIVNDAEKRLHQKENAGNRSVEALIRIIRDDIGEPELIDRLDRLLKKLEFAA